MSKVLIVTGASRGIGAATARLGGRAGFQVCVNYFNHREKAQAVVDEIVGWGGRAIAVKGDVSKESDVMRLFQTAERELGEISALVNNAGVTGGFALTKDVTVEQIHAVFNVNVVGSILCTREAVRRMGYSSGGRGGVIVNVSSTASRTGGSGEWVHYAATKGAIDTFTRGVAREVAGEGIRVNAVAPGLIHTDLHADNGSPDRPERLRSTIPVQRLGTPQEVAQAIVWLLSDEASYVIGSVVEVSGGR